MLIVYSSMLLKMIYPLGVHLIPWRQGTAVLHCAMLDFTGVELFSRVNVKEDSTEHIYSIERSAAKLHNQSVGFLHEKAQVLYKPSQDVPSENALYTDNRNISRTLATLVLGSRT